LIKNHPFMDGTKRTAFASAVYILYQHGYPVREQFPVSEVVEFCVAVAEENLRRSQGELITPRSISEIAEWPRALLGIP
jgi:prophage maintenance system killer protein